MDSLDYTRYYAHWHDRSDGHFEAMARYFEGKLGPLLPQDRGARVLDVGCGMGFALGGLSRLGYRSVEGIDADAGQVEAARTRGLPVTRVAPDEFEARMARHAGAHDVVLALDVLEHVPKPEQVAFLAAIRASLRPGGRFICQVPNANSGIAPRYRYGDWTHHTSFTELSLDFVLFSAGFDDIVVQEADPNVRPRFPLLLRKSVVRWSVLACVRAARRLELALELGTAKGIPLTPNILAVARR